METYLCCVRHRRCELFSWEGFLHQGYSKEIYLKERGLLQNNILKTKGGEKKNTVVVLMHVKNFFNIRVFSLIKQGSMHFDIFDSTY